MSTSYVRPISTFIAVLLVVFVLCDAPMPTRASSIMGTSSSCTVTSTADSGPGTLRECMATVTANDIIQFDPTVFPPSTPAVIALVHVLPELDNGNVTIDASDAGVILDGSAITSEGADGILIISSGNVVRGLHLRNFLGDGIDLESDASNNIIGGNSTYGSAPIGQGNILTQIADAGIQIAGAHNLVRGNYLGTADGQTAAGNDIGIMLMNGAESNTVGSTNPDERNLVSGNQRWGIAIGTGSANNVVVGNFVGVNAAGTALLPNVDNGVDIRGGAKFNRIGGSAPGEANVIAGSGGNNVFISDNDTMSNTVTGNRIGTDLNATMALSNTNAGVYIMNGPKHNVIGGTAAGAGNIIMAGGEGVGISGSDAQFNVVIGNFVGINPAGTVVSGFQYNGVDIRDGASHNRIGGFAAGERNVISGNENGIQLGGGPGTAYNEILGNYIGINPAGTSVIGTGDNGIYIWEQVHHNRVEGNTIGGAGNGIWISMIGTDDNVIARNYVGTNAEQTLTWPNTNSIGVQDGAQRNIIGPGNVVAFNQRGIYVWKPETIENTITQNSVYSNTDFAIGDFEGGNTELAAPVITHVDGGRTVIGTACPGCKVELFTDADGQARFYEGTVTADNRGNFTFTALCGLDGPNITATATDGNGNTSSLSLPSSLGTAEPACLFLPLGQRGLPN